jgi:nicotinate phosphoribosyltransferase
MKLNPIINSLLETDMYKFSMGQVIFHQFNKDTTTWTFKCRNKDVKFTGEMIKEIREQIDHYCTLRFTKDELDYLNNISWISKDYVDFLKFWHPIREEILINENYVQSYDTSTCGLTIEAKGTWLNTSMYEIAILAIVNEVYFAFKYGESKFDTEFVDRTVAKFNDLLCGNYNIGTFSEFGMRRRYSSRMQDWLIRYISDKKIPGFVGTSNVYLAKKYGIKPVGTMAHEYIMCVGQGHHEYNPAYSNKFAMKAWVKEYGVLNGIALTDTITTDCFLKDFDLTYATLFNGVRHDSGDPIEFGEKMIKHYTALGINPLTKTLLFSDSLNFEKADNIRKHFEGRINCAFGIGTYLSNPLDNPLNIVMKVTECNGSPVAKISDTPGKGMCKNEEYVDYLTRSIEWRMKNN